MWPQVLLQDAPTPWLRTPQQKRVPLPSCHGPLQPAAQQLLRGWLPAWRPERLQSASLGTPPSRPPDRHTGPATRAAALACMQACCRPSAVWWNCRMDGADLGYEANAQSRLQAHRQAGTAAAPGLCREGQQASRVFWVSCQPSGYPYQVQACAACAGVLSLGAWQAQVSRCSPRAGRTFSPSTRPVGLLPRMPPCRLAATDPRWHR